MEYSTYKVINFVKAKKWEGLIIEDKEGKQYYTTGVYKIFTEKLDKEKHEIKIVDSINLEKFLGYWKRNINANLIF